MRLRSRETWERLRSDLALFTLLQLPVLFANIVLSRALAAFHAYPYSRFAPAWSQVIRSLRYDLLALAALTSVALLYSRARLPERLRTLGLVAVYAGCWSLGALYGVSAGVFIRVGGPLTRNLARMGIPMVVHAPKIVSWDDPLIRLAAAGTVLPLIFTAATWSTARRVVGKEPHRSVAAWSSVLVIALLALASTALPANPGRERRLQQVSPLTLVLPAGWAVPVHARAPGPGHQRTLAHLIGPKRGEPAAAFAALPRQRRNVVFWVLESVGERFLRSHHVLGGAATPQLDRLAARGSVRFSNTFVECPLSAQSTYTLVTGVSPPANPAVFRSSLPVRPRAPYLPSLFAVAGYHTAFLNSSYLSIWGEDRFLREAGFDLLEDASNLANRSRYRHQPWSIEGRALVDRFFEWRDGLPAREPFFAVIWNVETHYNYSWIGMPPEYAADDELTRYNRAIEYTDRLLGTFSDGLAARGLADDTLIVAVGDHGQGLGRGERAYDRFESLLVGEDDIHVPLLFLHPALPHGSRVVDTNSTLADVYPTVLDLVGLPVPAPIDGASLAREYQPRILFSRAITWWPISARAGRFKLLQEFPTDPPALYDVADDPWEQRDVSGANEAVFNALWWELDAATRRVSREDPSFTLFAEGSTQR